MKYKVQLDIKIHVISFANITHTKSQTVLTKMT